MRTENRICSRCVLPDTFPGIAFDSEGICSVCRDHEQKWRDWDASLPERRRILDRLCADAKAKGRPFDALVPLSGGKDSTYVLWVAVKELGLRCLAYSLDNGYLTDVAKQNIDRACRRLDVEHVYYCLAPETTNEFFALFMRKTGYFCSVCMRAIEMATALVADIHRVPLVFGGSSSRTELPLTPEMFQPGRLGHVRSVLEGEPIAKKWPHLLHEGSLERRAGYRAFWWSAQKRVHLCAWVNLPDYVEWNYETVYRTIRDDLGWTAPPEHEEHSDCAIHPITTLMHNRRFPGLEVRRLTFARLIQAGQLTREEALRRLREEPEAECPEDLLRSFAASLGMTREEFLRYVEMGPRNLQYQEKPSPIWEVARSAKRLAFSTLGVKRMVK